MTDLQTLSAQEAAELLNISVNTLYSYVSRGLVRTEPSPDDPRARRYLREDIERLMQRKAYRRDPSKVAGDALDWGAPVLESALTLISGDGGHFYRGISALELAQTSTFEAVAGLLWLDDVEIGSRLFSGRDHDAPPETPLDLRVVCEGLIAALAQIDDVSAYNTAPENVVRGGARIIGRMVTTITGRQFAGGSCARALAEAWAGENTDVDALARLIDTALILCADHELNASSFAARVAAGTGANPYMAVIAGLAALSGHRHGGATRRVEAFMRPLTDAKNARAAVEDALRRGDMIPGFGHRLYPYGDPRARVLIEAAEDAYPMARFWAVSGNMIGTMRALTDLLPNVDFALVVASRVAGLPDGAPLALFTLGRTAGWIAHALEQYEQDTLIRPRARYVGRKID